MTFSWWTFLFEAVNFVVLAYVLHRLLYRPLRDAIDKRREANARAQAEAEKARQQAESLQQQLEEQRAAAEQQRQELMQQARKQAESERQKLLAQAEQAAQRRQEEAELAVRRERDEALKSLGEEVVAQAIALTERLLGGAAERSLDQQLILRLVQDLNELPETEKRGLRTECQPGNGPVLESAHELDAATLEPLTRAVSDIVGNPVSLSVQRRPKLLGGVRLRLGGQVWDASLAGQMTSDSQARTGLHSE